MGVLWAAVAAITFMVTACNADNHTTIKTVDQLSESEKGGLDALAAAIYKEVEPEGRLCMRYTTTYNVMPREDGSYGEKLDKPISLVSGACVGPHMLLPSTLAAIKEAMENKSITWTEDGKAHRIRIVEGFLAPSLGGAGGSMGMSNDMVTIVPTKLEVE